MGAHDLNLPPDPFIAVSQLPSECLGEDGQQESVGFGGGLGFQLPHYAHLWDLVTGSLRCVPRRNHAIQASF